MKLCAKTATAKSLSCSPLKITGNTEISVSDTPFMRDLAVLGSPVYDKC